MEKAYKRLLKIARDIKKEANDSHTHAYASGFKMAVTVLKEIMKEASK